MINLNDDDRRQFLLELGNSELELTEWEERFLEDVLKREQTTFSDKQREVINQMIAKYDDQLL